MNNQLLLFIFFLFGFSNLHAQTCYPDGVIIFTQGQIDDFATNNPGCTEVLGDLEIVSGTIGNISNLDGLSQLTDIGGDLVIRNNPMLEDLSGLHNISSVGGAFKVIDNPILNNIVSLSLLNSIGGDLTIQNNTQLANLLGLDNISSIAGALRISDNATLDNISNLSSLNSLGSRLSIIANPSLTNLTGLELIESYPDHVTIDDNDALTSLTGFDNVTSVNGDFFISKNDALPNLNGLNSLTHANGNIFVISQNDMMTDLSGLESLTTCEGHFWLYDLIALNSTLAISNLTTYNRGVRILNCDALPNLNGFLSVDTIQGSLEIESNGFNDMTGFNNLVHVGGDLDFLLNEGIETLAGLENLNSVGGEFFFAANGGLQNFSGLENLESIGGRILVVENPLLEDLLALESVSSVGGDISFLDNASLAVCNAPFLCDYILNGGIPEIEDNSSGCNSTGDVLSSCLGEYTLLTGQLIADIDQNCENTTGDIQLGEWIVNVYNDDFSISIPTDSSGDYWIPVPVGDWHLNVVSPYPFWMPCFADSLIQVMAIGDTVNTDLIVNPQGVCPIIDWDLTMPILRTCTHRAFVIDYCNIGVVVDDIIISVDLGDSIMIDSASVPYTIDGEGNVLFEIENLEIFDCADIVFYATVSCNAILDDALCVDVEILGDNLCGPDDLWDGSTVMANGNCQNDSILFELHNIGVGGMSQPGEFRVEIIIDDIVLLQDVDNYQLESGELLMLSYELDGMGMRLETEQVPGHPVGEDISLSVPNCSDIENNAIINMLPMQDGDHFMETFCGTIVGSYDPNIKRATPIGLGNNHEIDKDWGLDYTIEFQNTGNDTAFLVVVIDTLSELLDLNTLQVRGSTHPFTWDLNFNRELKFTFENILLPDSTTNESGSHGMVSFSIAPKADILPGELIENRVGIYFDFNDPIITNTVFHTIRKPIVASSEHVDWCAGEIYNGLEIWQDTSVQLLTEYIEYDSVHFVHFDVLQLQESEVTLDVEIGTYFEDILIHGDTIFTIAYDGQNNCDSLVTYNVSGLTDVDELRGLFNRVKVFPNPVNDFLMVLDHQTNEDQSWELVNNLGQVVWQQGLRPNEKLTAIAIKEFSEGVYWLHVKTKTTTGAWKVVVY